MALKVMEASQGSFVHGGLLRKAGASVSHQYDKDLESCMRQP